MIVASNLKWALLVCLLLKNTLIYGRHLETQLHDLADQRERSIYEVEHHSKQKLYDIEHEKQNELKHLLIYEQAVKHDIMNRHNLEENLALKHSIDQKLHELVKHQHQLQQHTGHALQDLDKQTHAVEFKKHELARLTGHKLQELEKQKQNLALKQHELELNINHKAHDVDHHKHDEHNRIIEHEHAVKEHLQHELHQLDHHKHDLALNHHVDDTFHDMERHSHILEQDHAFKHQLTNKFQVAEKHRDLAHLSHKLPDTDQHEHRLEDGLNQQKDSSLLATSIKPILGYKPDLHKKLPDVVQQDEQKTSGGKQDGSYLKHIAEGVAPTPVALETKASLDETDEFASKIDQRRHAIF